MVFSQQSSDVGVFHFCALRVDSPLFIPLGGVRGKEGESEKMKYTF